MKVGSVKQLLPSYGSLQSNKEDIWRRYSDRGCRTQKVSASMQVVKDLLELYMTARKKTLLKDNGPQDPVPKATPFSSKKQMKPLRNAEEPRDPITINIESFTGKPLDDIKEWAK